MRWRRRSDSRPASRALSCSPSRRPRRAAGHSSPSPPLCAWSSRPPWVRGHLGTSPERLSYRSPLAREALSCAAVAAAVAAALAACTLAASPLAFLLLAVVLAGVLLAGRARFRRTFVPSAVILLAGLAEVVLWRLFPAGGRYPFHTADALAGLTFCLLGLALTWR